MSSSLVGVDLVEVGKQFIGAFDQQLGEIGVERVPARRRSSATATSVFACEANITAVRATCISRAASGISSPAVRGNPLPFHIAKCVTSRPGPAPGAQALVMLPGYLARRCRTLRIHPPGGHDGGRQRPSLRPARRLGNSGIQSRHMSLSSPELLRKFTRAVMMSSPTPGQPRANTPYSRGAAAAMCRAHR